MFSPNLARLALLSSRPVLASLAALNLILFSHPSHAQPGQGQSAENVSAARALGAEGVQLAHDGKCKEAIERLSRAEQLYHAPTILVELGYCQCEQGQLVEGTEALNRVARENLGTNPPPAFIAAQERARGLLQQFTPKLAKLVIHVSAPPGAAFEVLVDGKPVNSALLGAPRPTDPGEHQIAAQGAGLTPATASINLEPGGQGEVSLKLEAAPVAALTPGTPGLDTAPGPTDSGPPASPTPKSSRVPAYVSFGVGGVALAAGGFLGWSALSKKSDLDKTCTDARCPEGSQSDIDSMNLHANLATAGFALGALGAGLGVYFLLDANAKDERANASASCTQAPCVRAQLGLSYLGMEGVF